MLNKTENKKMNYDKVFKKADDLLEKSELLFDKFLDAKGRGDVVKATEYAKQFKAAKRAYDRFMNNNDAMTNVIYELKKDIVKRPNARRVN